MTMAQVPVGEPVSQNKVGRLLRNNIGVITERGEEVGQADRQYSGLLTVCSLLGYLLG